MNNRLISTILPKMIHAVLFDLDGTLYDSESFYYGIYRDWLLEHFGAAITIEEFDHFELVLDDALIAHLIDSRRLVPAKGQNAASVRADILAESRRRFDELIESESAQTGAMLLRDFRACVDVPFALVTCSEIPNVYPFLDRYHLHDVFDLVLTGEDVAHKKPEPEIFHKALNHFGIDAAQAIAIEDARRGVLAARAAGITVIRPTAYLLVHEPMPEAVEVADLQSALALIEPLCAR